MPQLGARRSVKPGDDATLGGGADELDGGAGGRGDADRPPASPRAGGGASWWGPKRGPVVQTQNGPVQGLDGSKVSEWGEMNAFWGIPFAEAPVGPRRFRAPQPLARTWARPLQAKTTPAGCLQGGPFSSGQSEGPFSSGQSE